MVGSKSSKCSGEPITLTSLITSEDIKLLYAAADILKNNRFRLTASSGTKSERDISKEEYYLSTTRSKVGDYTLHQFHKSGLVFELNGDWFNHHYKGGPVDYWAGKLPHYGPGLKGRYSEMEDRVFSAEPYI